MLSVFFNIPNWFAGRLGTPVQIASVIWLGILGKWKIIVIGAVFRFGMQYVFNLSLLPALLLEALSLRLYNKKFTILPCVCLFIGNTIRLSITTIFCCLPFYYFTSIDTSENYIPLLLWSYCITTAPIRRVLGIVPDSIPFRVKAFFAQVGYVFMFIAALVLRPGPDLLIMIFSLTMLPGLILLYYFMMISCGMSIANRNILDDLRKKYNSINISVKNTLLIFLKYFSFSLKSNNLDLYNETEEISQIHRDERFLAREDSIAFALQNERAEDRFLIGAEHLYAARKYEKLCQKMTNPKIFDKFTAFDPLHSTYTDSLDWALRAAAHNESCFRFLPALTLLRATIGSSVAHIPVKVLEAMARLGAINQAQNYAERQADPAVRCEALCHLAHVHWTNGDRERAHSILDLAESHAQTITDVSARVEVWYRIAIGRFQAGVHDWRAIRPFVQAETVIAELGVDAQVRRVEALCWATRARFNSGTEWSGWDGMDKAEKIALAITDSASRFEAMMTIAHARLELGGAEGINSTFDEAYSAAKAITDILARRTALSRLAMVQLQHGDRPRAADALAEARDGPLTQFPEAYIEARRRFLRECYQNGEMECASKVIEDGEILSAFLYFPEGVFYGYFCPSGEVYEWPRAHGLLDNLAAGAGAFMGCELFSDFARCHRMALEGGWHGDYAAIEGAASETALIDKGGLPPVGKPLMYRASVRLAHILRRGTLRVFGLRGWAKCRVLVAGLVGLTATHPEEAGQFLQRIMDDRSLGWLIRGCILPGLVTTCEVPFQTIHREGSLPDLPAFFTKALKVVSKCVRLSNDPPPNNLIIWDPLRFIMVYYGRAGNFKRALEEAQHWNDPDQQLSAIALLANIAAEKGQFNVAFDLIGRIGRVELRAQVLGTVGEKLNSVPQNEVEKFRDQLVSLTGSIIKEKSVELDACLSAFIIEVARLDSIETALRMARELGADILRMSMPSLGKIAAAKGDIALAQVLLYDVERSTAVVTSLDISMRFWAVLAFSHWAYQWLQTATEEKRSTQAKRWKRLAGKANSRARTLIFTATAPELGWPLASYADAVSLFSRTNRTWVSWFLAVDYANFLVDKYYQQAKQQEEKLKRKTRHQRGVWIEPQVYTSYEAQAVLVRLAVLQAEVAPIWEIILSEEGDAPWSKSLSLIAHKDHQSLALAQIAETVLHRRDKLRWSRVDYFVSMIILRMHRLDGLDDLINGILEKNIKMNHVPSYILRCIKRTKLEVNSTAKESLQRIAVTH